MHEPRAFFDGRFIPASAAAIPLTDSGFVLGTTVAEQLRTFHGKIFRMEDHLRRLWHSLALLEVMPPLPMPELADAARELVTHNHPLLNPGDDLGVSIVVTPGPHATYGGSGPSRPLLCIHTYPLPFQFWADKYRVGQRLCTTNVVQVPAECWPREVKCRSRMHYYLADHRAAAADPGARALLLDQQGHITEASTANILLYTTAQGLVSPPRATVLPGVSLAVLADLAAKRGLAFGERTISPADLVVADEVLLCSTPFCLLPVTYFNTRPLGDGTPGPIFQQLLASWSEVVGVDIVQQAQRFAPERTTPVVAADPGPC